MKYLTLHVNFKDENEISLIVNNVKAGYSKLFNYYWYNSFSGKYMFNVRTNKVTLNDGVNIKEIDCEWEIIVCS